MTRIKRPLLWVLLIFSLVPLIYLYGVASQFGFFGEWAETPAQVLSHFTMESDGTTTPITLPYTMEDGSPNQTVTLTTQVENTNHLRLYIKSVYAPFRVYANDQLLYEYGKKGTYPNYLEDPAVRVLMMDLPNSPSITLRLEYDFPLSRGDLILEPPLVGTYPSIFIALLSQQARFSALFLFFIWFGLLILCIGAIVQVFEQQGMPFVWLGLLSLCCGLWEMGEYDISGLIIQNESLLYLLGFTGVFYLPVPIHFYFRSTVNYRNPKPITTCGLVCLLLATTASILQACSILSFYNAMPYLIAVSSLSFCFIIGYTIYEWRIYGNEMAKRFLLPWTVVICAAFVEALRFIQGKDYGYGHYAQIGLLIFILVNGIIGGFLVRKTLMLRHAHRRMEQEYKLMEVQVAGQRRYHHLLLETRQALRQQRHDLHHQLAVIRGLAQEGNLDKLNHHLDSLDAQVPDQLETHCENIAVNAIVAYYVTKAKANGVTVTTNLVVPEPAVRISDSNLCVIFGNILENAVEACGRMSGQEKFITLTSHLRNEMLVITQKNSFEGTIHRTGEKFCSSKRDEMGIGLTSVQSVACKHGGNATFTVEGRAFHSAIYVKI